MGLEITKKTPYNQYSIINHKSSVRLWLHDVVDGLVVPGVVTVENLIAGIMSVLDMFYAKLDHNHTDYVERHHLQPSWTTTSEGYPNNMINSQSAIIGTYFYVFGSTFVTQGKAIYRAALANPLSWTALSGMLPEQIRKAQLAIIGDYIYLFGGTSSDRIHRAPISDPETWSTLTGELPEAVSDAQLAIIGEYIYLFGGWASDRIHRAPISDPETWNTLAGRLPAKISDSHLAILGEYVYLFGGTVEDTPTTMICRASRKSPDMWEALSWTSPGYELSGSCAKAQIMRIGDTLYLFGGAYGNSIYSTPLNIEHSLLYVEEDTSYEVALGKLMSDWELQENVPWKIGGMT